MRIRILVPLLCVVPLAAFAMLGPPRITVTHQGVRGDTVAFVHGQHHTDLTDVPVTGRLETVASGQRISYAIKLDKLPSAGRYVIRRVWDTARPVVLVLTLEQGDHGEHGVAEAVVRVAAGGTVVGVEYPRGSGVFGAQTPRRATPAEITAALDQLGVRVAD